MRDMIRLIVKDFGWIHTSLGLLGNVLFFVGSILFLPAFESHQTLGVWLFIIGSFCLSCPSVMTFLVAASVFTPVLSIFFPASVPALTW